MHIPESFWMQFRLLEVNVMSEKREVILEAKHITRKFPASHGRTLLANDDINLKMYKGDTWPGRRIRLRKKYIYEISGIAG